MSNLALWATITAPRANSRNIGNTAEMVGASHTIAVVIPVSWTICGGMLRCGSTRVANSPSTTPPRTLTAPISVMASATFPSRAVMRPPVVSRSTTTKVVSRSDISAAPSRVGEAQLLGSGRAHGGDVNQSHRHGQGFRRGASATRQPPSRRGVNTKTCRCPPDSVTARPMSKTERTSQMAHDSEPDWAAAAPPDSTEPVVIDCDDCAVRGPGCHDCVVSVILGVPETLLEDERVALEVLADAGLAPRLRLVPIHRQRPGVA